VEKGLGQVDFGRILDGLLGAEVAALPFSQRAKGAFLSCLLRFALLLPGWGWDGDIYGGHRTK
jgi:Zn-dependent protease